jgi:hypothetical protein
VVPVAVDVEVAVEAVFGDVELALGFALSAAADEVPEALLLVCLPPQPRVTIIRHINTRAPNIVLSIRPLA